MVQKAGKKKGKKTWKYGGESISINWFVLMKRNLLQMPVFHTAGYLMLKFEGWLRTREYQSSADYPRKCPLLFTLGKWWADKDKKALGVYGPSLCRRNSSHRIFLAKESRKWRKHIFPCCFVYKHISLSFLKNLNKCVLFSRKKKMLVLTPCSLIPFPVTSTFFTDVVIRECQGKSWVLSVKVVSLREARRLSDKII